MIYQKNYATEIILVYHYCKHDKSVIGKLRPEGCQTWDCRGVEES